MPPAATSRRSIPEIAADFLRAVLTLGLDRVLERGFDSARQLPGKGVQFSGASALVGVGLLYLYAIVIAFLAVLSLTAKINHLSSLTALWPALLFGGTLIVFCCILGPSIDLFVYYVRGKLPDGLLCHTRRDLVKDNLHKALQEVAVKQALVSVLRRMTKAQIRKTVDALEKQLKDCRGHLDSAATTLQEIGTAVGLCQGHM